MNIIRNSPKGFTLVELLVVVSIIGILATIGGVVYTGVQENARDQQRIRDLNSLKQGLELYRHDQHYYPHWWNLLTTGLTFSSKSYIKFEDVPTDPKPPPWYAYQALPSGCNNFGIPCTRFCLYAKLENEALASIPSLCPSAPNYNFAITLD